MSSKSFASCKVFAWRHVFCFLALLIAAGCGPHVPFALSKADADRFKGNVLRIDVPGHDPKIFGISDCVVYRAQTAHGDIVGWTVVLASDWGGSYPKWYTVCTRSHIGYDGKYINAFLCAQAIGAGGGCADGGDYRSRTGDVQGWELNQGGYWNALPNYDQPSPAPKKTSHRPKH
jgi:hypothetical protein